MRFTGKDLSHENWLTVTGVYPIGTNPRNFRIKITDTSSIPNKFRYSVDGGYTYSLTEYAEMIYIEIYNLTIMRCLRD